MGGPTPGHIGRNRVVDAEKVPKELFEGTIWDLFSGAGGFSRGFEQAGFRISVAVENFKPMIKAYKANFPQVHLVGADIKKVNVKELVEEFGRPLIIIGGPPCEPFTKANPKRKKNPRDRLYEDGLGRLVLHFIRFVSQAEPEVYVLENVPDIKDVFPFIKQEFDACGYEAKLKILYAQSYGVPSRRARAFISNVKLRPKKEKGKICVWDAINDLPDPRIESGIENHVYIKISKRRLEKIKRLKWGQALFRFKGQGFVGKNWIRLHPYRLAPTIHGSSRFIHPFDHRLLTVREQARLMGFPDDHVFRGSIRMQFEQVGEAVPPPLARAIALYLRKRL